MKNLPKYLSFGSVAVLIVLMAAATVLEKIRGTEAAFQAVFHHPVFIVLWAVAAVCGLIWLIRRGVPRKVFTMGLHLAFVLILAGALTTFLWGEQGELHLRVGEESDRMVLEDGSAKALPFRLRLDNFTISYYSGSKAPSDFSSSVTVLPEERAWTISMNHILKHRGYRFFQADFDEDRQGSTLAVSHDPWGTGLTYAGYLLLALCMLGFFFQRDTAFRSALRRLARASAVVLALLAPSALEAKAPAEEAPKVLPGEAADALGELFVYYNDRICPLSTLCRDYCLKAYGKGSWNGYSAEQVITGWLFYYDWWQVVPFKVKAKDKGTPREREKEFLRRSVSAGDAFRIFPLADEDGNITWYNCNEPLPPAVMDRYELWAFIRKSLDLMEESVRQEDWDGVVRLAGAIRSYQEKTAGSLLPSPAKVRAERLYNDISRPMVPFMAAITLGILLFLLSGFLMARGRQLPPWLQHLTGLLLGALWLYLTLVLGLRWYVSGHAPFAGSYCVMMLMAWFSSLAAVLLYRRLPLLLPAGLLIAGFTLLMASLASANPQITHLMPVLQSPLLSIHVLSMMLSYTLFGLVALCGIMGLVMPTGGPSERLRDVSTVFLYPGVFLITFGTFLGAVWANISWGSYWGWDPKETWALITLLIYAMALHGGSLGFLRRTKVFHAYCILAFLAVLITYFGVNLLLGGMHAYS